MKRKFFEKYYRLLPKQNWLVDKEESLANLINYCSNENQEELIFKLLNEFYFINETLLPRYLNYMADYIVNKSNFNIEETQIIAMTMDDNPDSSQWILHQLKPYLTKKGWNNVKITTRFDKGIRIMNKQGLSKLILIDEFIGSGQSVEGRIKLLNERATCDFEIKACFIAGMETGIRRVKDSFSEFICFIPLTKGISDYFTGKEKETALSNMIDLEKTLLQKIDNKELNTYHFGYGEAESLYSSFGNVPNSVFPFFWWPYDVERHYRNPILIRTEEGLSL